MVEYGIILLQKAEDHNFEYSVLKASCKQKARAWNKGRGNLTSCCKHFVCMHFLKKKWKEHFKTGIHHLQSGMALPVLAQGFATSFTRL